MAIERTNEFRGLYHVLGGSISPIDGRGPADLHTRELFQRLADGVVSEVIIATDPDTQGEATASYLSRMLRDFGVRITRPASGLPVGGDLEYADQATLGRSFEGLGARCSDRRIIRAQPAVVAPSGEAPRLGSPATPIAWPRLPVTRGVVQIIQGPRPARPPRRPGWPRPGGRRRARGLRS